MDSIWTELISEINNLPVDSDPDILVQISKYHYIKPDTVDIRAELSSSDYEPAILAQFYRWCEIAQRVNKPLHIFALSYNIDVERKVYKLLNSTPDITITVIPGKWKARYF